MRPYHPPRREGMAEPAPGPEARQADATAFFRDAPPLVITNIILRLPARSVLRLLSVCKVLRDVTSSYLRMLVFNTEAEVFSWMSSPNHIREGSMQLLEMDRKLAMSVSRNGRPTLELWRLEDYHNEIWVQIYRIRIPVMHIPELHYIDWFPHVVSPEGDVLIECSSKLLLHCDRNGNLLQKFQFREETPLVRHTLKETLLPHAIFQAPKITNGDFAPPFFEGI